MPVFDSLLGGVSKGNANASATQEASVSYIPEVYAPSPPPLVSTYPAGQGLSTVGYALPSSAAWSMPISTSGTSSSSSLSTWLLLGGLAVGGFFLMRHAL